VGDRTAGAPGADRDPASRRDAHRSGRPALHPRRLPRDRDSLRPHPGDLRLASRPPGRPRRGKPGIDGGPLAAALPHPAVRVGGGARLRPGHRVGAADPEPRSPLGSLGSPRRPGARRRVPPVADRRSRARSTGARWTARPCPACRPRAPSIVRR
jgi:hypothetical protein